MEAWPSFKNPVMSNSAHCANQGRLNRSREEKTTLVSVKTAISEKIIKLPDNYQAILMLNFTRTKGLKTQGLCSETLMCINCWILLLKRQIHVWLRKKEVIVPFPLLGNTFIYFQPFGLHFPHVAAPKYINTQEKITMQNKRNGNKIIHSYNNTMLLIQQQHQPIKYTHETK